MGVGGEKKPMHEIAETRAAAKDDAFEEIVERIKAAADEFEDEIHPLYTSVGMDDFELGTERVIKFTIKNFDFILTRKVETHVLSGAGHQKHVEELEVPRAHEHLKRKSSLESDWQVVDLEDMF